MSTEAQKRASKKYAAGNTKQIALVLNVKTDADIIKYLKNQENKQGHIKELIREAMREEEKMTAKWYLIESDGGDRFEHRMNAETRDEAEHKLRTRWAKMSEYDRKRTSMFMAAFVKKDEDGCINIDEAEEVIEL